MNNLFISYDLNSPGQDYSKVIDAIKALGGWAKVQKSLWYVNTTLSATEALNRVKPTLDRNDSLIVIDATNKTATWYGLSDEVAKYIINSWTK
jgi:hypothetical protein